jgi:hypothetical protein
MLSTSTSTYSRLELTRFSNEWYSSHQKLNYSGCIFLVFEQRCGFKFGLYRHFLGLLSRVGKHGRGRNRRAGSEVWNVG